MRRVSGDGNCSISRGRVEYKQREFVLAKSRSSYSECYKRKTRAHMS